MPALRHGKELHVHYLHYVQLCLLKAATNILALGNNDNQTVYGM